ncbi:M56 family metallopeptidase [Actinocatenispora sera]|uniref:M56 family metallopeptidase n=1 Tax=Actinocatenispora sera TaxID=390989 RepID=UPI0033C6D967
MTLAAVLLGLAVLTGAAGPRLLRSRRLAGAPAGLSVLLWVALPVALAVAVLVAGAALVLPSFPAGVTVLELVRLCAGVVGGHPSQQVTLAAGAISAAASVGVVGRLAWCAAHVWWPAHRHARRHRQALELTARRVPSLGAYVVEADSPLAYCLPGSGGRVVLTSSALDALGDDELHAVLAHERAHLTQRHDKILAGVVLLARAFPFVPLFRAAQRELPRLVEMAADDVAASAHGRFAVASALVTLAGDDTARPASLAAATVAVRDRFDRLLSAEQTPTLPAAAYWLAGTLTVAAPVLISAALVAVGAYFHACPFVLYH